LFCTYHRPDLIVNQMASPARDRLVRTPEYKVDAARVEKVTHEALCVDGRT